MVFITRFILIVIATWAGFTLMGPLAIAGCRLDIGLLALILIGANTNRGKIVAWGAFSGFLVDCMNPAFMGAGIVSRATAAMFLSSMREKLNIEHPFMDGIVIFAAGIIDGALYFGLTAYRQRFFFGLVRYTIPGAFYTAVVAILLIMIYRLRYLIQPRLS